MDGARGSSSSSRPTERRLQLQATSGIGSGYTWQVALDQALAQMRIPQRTKFDLCFLFASPAYEEFYSSLLKAVREAVPARHLIGCSAAGVIGVRREVESEPGLALAAVTMPGAVLSPFQCSWIEMSKWDEDACRTRTGGDATPNAWFVFADPYTVNAEGILRTMSGAYEGVPLIGGLATAEPGKRHTFLFLDGVAYTGGVVGIGIGGAWTATTVVSQGCQPIGETWTVTAAEGNLIHGISGRPAFDVLQETMDALPESTRRRLGGQIFIGLAMDEYRSEYGHGDFLIRNVLGVDRKTYGLAIGAHARVGQTIQFQLRDRDAAHADLEASLAAMMPALPAPPLAALLCSCNGRGADLFGAPHHDARAVAEHVGKVPLAGFFCNGEIGPVGGRNFLHGFTASVAFLVPSADSDAAERATATAAKKGRAR